MAFEVASVKRSKPGVEPNLRLENNHLTADLTLSGYIGYAYDQPMDSAHLPKWVSSDSFEIDARAAGTATKNEVRLMLQSLLAERFKLEVHIVTAEAPVLALLLDKPEKTGPRLRPHAEGPPCGAAGNSAEVFPPVCEEVTAMPGAHGTILVGARNATMKQIAGYLAALPPVGGPVVDQTGLSGRFDFRLEFTPGAKGAPAPAQGVPTDFTVTTFEEAFHEQLGLKLKATRAPQETLVVDRVEQPSEN